MSDKVNYAMEIPEAELRQVAALVGKTSAAHLKESTHGAVVILEMMQRMGGSITNSVTVAGVDLHIFHISITGEDPDRILGAIKAAYPLLNRPCKRTVSNN